MKRLLLCRHAKSSWKDLELSDRDRPLNKRGKRDAPVMGRRLAAQGIRPDLIVTSPALRALKTARKIAREVGYKKKQIVIREEFYGASAEGVLDVVKELGGQFELVMIVGHNPEITVLANILGDLDVDNVPTCGMAAFSFAGATWKDIEKGEGTLLFFDYPRKIGPVQPG